MIAAPDVEGRGVRYVTNIECQINLIVRVRCQLYLWNV